MTRRLPLFEFMPYGAPELLEQSRPGMARALALGSLAWFVLFALLLSTGPWNRSPVVIEFTPSSPGHPTMKPPSVEPPALRKVRPVVPSVPREAARIVPVIDPPVELPILPSMPTTSGGDAAGAGAGPTSGEPGGISIDLDAPPAEPILARDADREPTLISAKKPLYPDLPREAGVEGDVMLRLLVGFDGRVEEVTVMKGVPMLNEAATSAARHWVFTAPMFNGKPVRVWVDVPVRFRLHSN